MAGFRVHGPTDREADKLKALRKERNTLLADSDWALLDDSPLTTNQKTTVRTYRTALRDVMALPNPKASDFPSLPNCLKDNR